MAKRKTSFRIPSTEIQGEGSFVEIVPVTVAEARKVKASLDHQSDDEQAAENAEFLARHIIGWDWVDDDGNPLPLPKDDPSVVERLYAHESSFLGEAIGGTIKQKK